MSDCCIGIRDIDGVDLGYKLVPKKDLLKPLLQNSDSLIRGGELWVWGANCNGMLGINATTTLRASSPIQTIAGGTNWKFVTASIQDTVAATKTDGTLWLWGCNRCGALGDNTSTAKSSPVQTVSGGTNWKHVSAGPAITSAIKTDGTLWMWGSPTCQPFPLSTNLSSPVQNVTGGSDWKQIFSGGTTLSITNAAIKTDGSLWVWGNCLTNIPAPPRLDNVCADNIRWCDAWTGQNAIAALKEDGSMWTWGNENLTTTGLNNFGSFQRSADCSNDWKSLQKSVSVNSATAIKKDNSAWFWGYSTHFLTNEYFPDGGFFYYARQPYGEPMTVAVGKNSWLCLITPETSAFGSLGIKTDGTLWAWGATDDLAIQPVTCASSTVTVFCPVQIGNCSGWKVVAAQDETAFAIK